MTDLPNDEGDGKPMTTKAHSTSGAGAWTPGPWSVVFEDHDISVSGEGWFENQNVNGWVVVGNLENPEMAIAVLDTGYRNEWADEKLDANARLIAAAPALYEALEEAWQTLLAIGVISGNPAGEEAAVKASAALRLAQGTPA